ncbi:MAG TPA: nitroreductase family protein [Candidatus Paceibacterota bacterium]|nr:nitroreductase family protein [Candidatus Paceibacterota bacterium]
MVTEVIKNRRSVREYKANEIPEKYINEIIKAGQFAPSACNNRAVEFIVIKNQKIKDEIFRIIGQKFIKEAPVLIIPATDTRKTNFPIQDLSVASENMFLEATALGLGTVWKAVSGVWEEKIKELLGVPKEYKIINVIPVGRPKERTFPHSEADFDPKKIHKEKW